MPLQAFQPDLIMTDFILAGGLALADKLGIPKALMMAAHVPPLSNQALGSGSHLLATVPQFNTGLPRNMVRRPTALLLYPDAALPC